jgi:hypothetical protein
LGNQGIHPRIWRCFLPSDTWHQIRSDERASTDLLTIRKQRKKIKEQAALPAIDFLLENEVAPINTELSTENIWQYLEPCFIEIHESNYSSTHEGEANPIAISLGFEVPWENEHLLQIGTIDGNFDEVYSE